MIVSRGAASVFTGTAGAAIGHEVWTRSSQQLQGPYAPLAQPMASQPYLPRRQASHYPARPPVTRVVSGEEPEDFEAPDDFEAPAYEPPVPHNAPAPPAPWNTAGSCNRAR